jgi:hypothetical protein
MLNVTLDRTLDAYFLSETGALNAATLTCPDTFLRGQAR